MQIQTLRVCLVICVNQPNVMLLIETFQQQKRALAFQFLLAEFLKLLSVVHSVVLVIHASVFALKDMACLF